jgi:hypothetical protein
LFRRAEGKGEREDALADIVQLRNDCPPLLLRPPPFLHLLLLHRMRPHVFVLLRHLTRENRFKVVAVVDFKDGKDTTFRLREEVFVASVRVCRQWKASVRRKEERK